MEEKIKNLYNENNTIAYQILLGAQYIKMQRKIWEIAIDFIMKKGNCFYSFNEYII